MCADTGYYNGNDLQGCLFFNACQSEPCLNGGSCILAELDYLGYRCVCPNGFTGRLCENINECQSPQQPCQNGAICEDRLDGYQCYCARGFTGINCTINIDECATNPCQNNGTCTDLIADYACNCTAGFTGDNCDINIDDCVSDPCMNGGSCNDLVNGFSCTCPGGFTGNCCELAV